MFPTSTSERLTEAVTRSHALWDQRPRGQGPPPGPPFTIALSREAGANGHLVAQTVGAALGWPVYDKELVQRIAEGMGLQAEILEGVDEKQKGWIRECLEGLLPGKEVSDPAFVHRLLKAVATLAARGQCVIVGRGATQVLPPASTLRVRLVAPRADRIAAIQARRGLSRAEAEKWVDRTDAERTRFVRDHFHHDPGEAHRYDLVLNTARLGIPACAEMIVSALRRLQAAAVPANAAG